MPRYIRKYLMLFVILLTAGGLFSVKTVQAASAEVVLSTDSNSVTAGDVFFVYITINSATQFTDVEASLTYDDELLEYQGGNSKIKGSSGYLKVSDIGSVNGATEKKYTLKFEALKVGVCNISFSDSIMVYEFASGEAMSVSNNTMAINVVAPVTASTDTKLKTLQISPSQLSPEFDAETYVYSVDVDYDTQKLIVVALPEDEKASVSISGNETLNVGQNKVVIKVLAESGDVIEYSINVNRAQEAESAEPETIGVPENESNTSFEIKRIDGEKYAYYSGRYKLLEPEADITIPEGYIKTKLIISDISFTAYSPKDDLESDFLLIYAENESGEAGLYRYDRMEKTLQRYTVGKDNIIINDTTDSEIQKDLIASEEYRMNLTKAAVVIALLCALCVLMIAIIIRMIVKSRGYREDDLD